MLTLRSIRRHNESTDFSWSWLEVGEHQRCGSLTCPYPASRKDVSEMTICQQKGQENSSK